MRKILSSILGIGFVINSFFINASALEVTTQGRGIAPLTGYDIEATRTQENIYMHGKANNAKTEFMHAQQIKEASRQAKKRKKEDKRLSGTVRTAVVTVARERADKNAIDNLINDILGADAIKNPQVVAKLNDIYSQVDVFAINKSYKGEVIDNNYVSNVIMTVDETAFRKRISNLGIALHTHDVKAQNILIVMDEFFTTPSDMHTNVLTKEVTTYDYKYNEKDKETVKASYKDSSKSNSSAGYGNWYGAGYGKSSDSSSTSANYGNYVDYSKNQSEFFQNIKEYAPKNPVAQNSNLTLPELEKAFKNSGITVINNSMFKSKYFKAKPISSDQLSNSEELVKYVKYAQDEAKADFFAIGNSYITDNGVDASTGMRASSGHVNMVIYSTQDGKVIASGTFQASAIGDTADTARRAVAAKLGPGLGNELAKQIQDDYKDRTMYGTEYTLEVKGNFLPIERVNITKALKTVDGIQHVALKSSDNVKLEYTVNYSGSEPVGDTIFMQLVETSAKFNNYNYTINRGQIIFEPLKGHENL